MPSAHRNIRVVAANLDLCPGADGVALLVQPNHHRRLASAVADGLDLAQFIGPCKQMTTALEQFSLKVGTQSVGKDWDFPLVHDLAELVHLRLRQKLSFVNQHAVQRILRQSGVGQF